MPFQNLYNNIFDTKEAGEDPVELLERQVTRYPYFTLAHFFLLKYSRQGHPGYAGIAARTAMHFNHPFFLHQQLHKVADAQVAIDNEFATVFHTPDSFPEEILETEENGVHDEIYPEEVINETEYETEPPAIVAGAVEDATDAALFESPAAIIEVETPSTLHPADEEVEQEQDVVVENEPVTETGTFTPENTEEPAVVPQSSHLEPVETIELEPAPEVTIEPEAPPTEKEAPLFEPLFATDYFASQGIKLREEVAANDKLGKQLRSFTDWLKTMKKVHEGKLPAGSETLDLSVQKLAEKSNKEEDVLTETMAEVYLQQGKQQKAKEIYEKLSLLNPSKMAYFAAKIDQIQ